MRNVTKIVVLSEAKDLLFVLNSLHDRVLIEALRRRSTIETASTIDFGSSHNSSACVLARDRRARAMAKDKAHLAEAAK
jgi:hypothetical protein